MSQQRYQESVELLRSRGGAQVANRLPEKWPRIGPKLNNNSLVKDLRSVAATRNEGVLLIGWGDGEAIRILRGDHLTKHKNLKVLIFADEMDAFAHSLGVHGFAAYAGTGNLSLALMFPDQDVVQSTVSSFYNGHDAISRLVGDRLFTKHPLPETIASQRQQALPQIERGIVERLDMLGNDVYDTFTGAKHIIGNRQLLTERPRSSNLVNLHQGQSAIVIASGPSLSEHLEHIKSIQHEHVLICADSILGGLLDAGIEPDYVTMVERPQEMSLLIEPHAKRCATKLVAVPWVHPDSVVDYEDRVIWWWNPDDIFPWLDPNEPRVAAGRSTGTMGVALAGLFGAW